MKRWLFNIATSYMRFVVAMLAVFFLTPYILSEIGVEQYGFWALILAITGMLGLLDFGLATAAVKYVAERTGANDVEGRNRILSMLLSTYLVLGTAALCIAGIFALSFDGAPLSNSLEMPDRTSALAVLIGLTVALGLLLSLFRAALAGSGCMHLGNAVEIGMTLLSAALSVYFLSSGFGVVGLATALALSTLFGLLGMLALSYRQLDRLELCLRFEGWYEMRALLAFSSWVFIANAAVLLILRMDPLIIKAYMPLSAVAVYAIAARIAEYALLFNKQFSNALMPLVSQAHGRGSAETVRNVLTNATRYLLALTLPMLALTAFHAENFLLLWVGEEFIAAAPIVQLLAAAVACMALQLNASNVLGMTGRHRFVSLSMGASAVLNLTLTIALLPRFGLLGAALATLFAAATIDAGVILPAACRHVGVRLVDFAKHILAPCLPPLVPMFGVAWILDALFPPQSVAVVLLQAVVAALVFSGTFFFTGLSSVERVAIISQVRRNQSSSSAAEGGLA